jgi:hypothetical protein
MCVYPLAARSGIREADLFGSQWQEKFMVIRLAGLWGWPMDGKIHHALLVGFPFPFPSFIRQKSIAFA